MSNDMVYCHNCKKKVHTMLSNRRRYMDEICPNCGKHIRITRIKNAGSDTVTVYNFGGDNVKNILFKITTTEECIVEIDPNCFTPEIRKEIETNFFPLPEDDMKALEEIAKHVAHNRLLFSESFIEALGYIQVDGKWKGKIEKDAPRMNINIIDWEPDDYYDVEQVEKDELTNLQRGYLTESWEID